MMQATAVKPITLTADQQSAMDSFHDFLLDPQQTVFVITGYSGCGKSTLVRTIIDTLPSFKQAIALVDSDWKYETVLTATTNKAAENLSQIVGDDARTIHSFLGLRVQTDWKTGNTTLVATNHTPLENYLVFIDEASQIDNSLLQKIFERLARCKVVFIGDPAQLTAVNSSKAPVFHANFNEAKLTEVVRQAAGNPIVDLSTKFRNTVNTGQFFSFKPDGHHIKHMDRDSFNEAIKAEFTRPDWRFSDSKILGWTNKCVISYNQQVRALVGSQPDFQVGEYAICNSYMSYGRNKNIKTEQLVQITRITDPAESHGVPGKLYEVDNYMIFFMPETYEARAQAIKKFKAEGNLVIANTIDQDWIDLRAAYACTINKAQGSTFDKVFIDLNDVSKCNNGDTLARLLYVAVSRARNHVYLTGDLA